MTASTVRAVSPTVILSPVSAADTAAATSSWIDVRTYEGDAAVVLNVGAITGSISAVIEHASDNSGTGAATLDTFAAITANTVQKITIRPSGTQGFIRVKGTVVTGPVLISASLLSRLDTV